MDKMKFESLDMTAQNIDRIAALFPNCITEMLDEERSTPEKKVYKRAVNFELLKQMLSPDVVDGDEAYEFTWVGKKAAIVEANKPIRKTLRPCKEESKDWNTTENLYIEGDNLEVLKLLQESYLGKVKMIYIDPPYNTGNDFIYADDFMRSQEEENAQMGMYDEDKNRLFKNTDTNGRFHSDWCSMIYSRLMLARNLLTDDGVIFISIDDNEQENLEKICDEVFGRTNMVGMILWKKKTNGNNMGFLPPVHDYILCYAKSIEMISEMGYPVTNEFISKTFSNPDDDARGPWTTSDLSANHKGPYFAICNPKTGEIHYPPQGRYWVFNEQEVKKRIADGRIIFGKSGTGRPIQKIFLSSKKLSKIRADSWWADNGMNEDATKELSELFGVTKLFTHPKPSKLLYHLCKICTDNNDCILDFFSGSATTAHAIMQLNAEDGGHRKFIMVQLPEKCDEASEAYKAGYKNICEIGKERIRRAGDKIKQALLNDGIAIRKMTEYKATQGNLEGFSYGEWMEAPEVIQAKEKMASSLDVGFRVLKLDDTNMKDVYYAPDDYDQGMLAGLESNIKDDRTDLDLLFGCLIDWGLPLSLPYKSEQLSGCTVHTYNDGDLIACFDANIPESVVKEIAQRKPLRAVFRDSGFASSPEKINVFEIFKLYMPEDANDISKRVRVI